MRAPNASGRTEPTFWAAPDLAKAGYPVFPVNGKEPTVEGGFYACTTDMSQIAEWIDDGRGDHDVAIPTGLLSGVVVIDADIPETYAKMEERYGKPTVLTRRGGHWWFHHPRNGKVTSNSVEDGLDRKGDGGFVVVPPSRGRTWTGGIPDKNSLPVLPREFWSKTREKTNAPRTMPKDKKDAAAEAIAARVSRVPQGQRHEHLRHLCGVLLARNVAAGDAEDVLIAAWTKTGGDLMERASREIPNTLATTERALTEGRATGVPSLEEITPGLYAELEAVFGWPSGITFGSRKGYADDASFVNFVSFVPEPWPSLSGEAFYGLPGEIVRSVERHTEADPVAILINLLAAVGNAIGRGAFFRVGADTHHLKVNAALVGETSKGRKGMSWGHVRELMQAADPEWADERVLHGLSSGEGLIYAVRDRVEGENKKGESIVIDSGVEDKRLLVLEAELAGVLKVMTREGNTLSPTIRQAWDDGKLQTLTKNSPMTATGAHVSILGHITKAELLRHLTETEAANGFANRFVWLLVKRSKELPFGGEWFKVDKGAFIQGLVSALDFGGAPVEIGWGESAREAWREVYGPLSEGKPGLFGAVVGRAEAQVVRLAALYAVMDESYEIEYAHLLAALALWDYAEASARYIFGDATGDPTADQIAEALKAAGDDGMTRTEISHLFGRNKSADRLERSLMLLLTIGRVRRETQETRGRRAERWFSK